MTTIAQALCEEAQKRLLGSFKLRDWQGDDINDPVTMDVSVEAQPERIDVNFVYRDKLVASVWLEVEDGMVRVHAYDPAHDAPVSLRIFPDNISITQEDRRAANVTSPRQLWPKGEVK